MAIVAWIGCKPNSVQNLLANGNKIITHGMMPLLVLMGDSIDFYTWQLEVSLRNQTLVKFSKSRDLIAIAICDSNRESQITSGLRKCEPWQKSPMF